MPDAHALVEYGVQMEQLGFDSLWVWDHVLLGVEPNFPIIEVADAADRDRRAHQEDQARHRHSGAADAQSGHPGKAARAAWTCLSDGRLIMGMASGWYKREFDAVGVPFEKRGKIMDENLDILKRFWTEDMVKGEFMLSQDSGRRHVSQAGAEAASADPDRRLCRSRAQARRRRRRRLAHLFLRPESFAKSWGKIRDFAKEAGKDPDKLLNASQLPIMHRQIARRGRERDDGVARQGVGLCLVASDSTKDSAIIGTVDECVEQLKAHLAVGVQKLIFVPYRYEMEQIEIIAREIIPRLKKM